MTVWIRRVQGGEMGKNQDVDAARRKDEGVYSKSGVLHVEKMAILRDEEVGGLEMVTTDET